ncbi:MAG TPA: site-2 protease family protein [Pyrinomonadaceae bacterium]|nr:site-2 protease family protein [Pyrinomonadaceae bacterium]
MVLSYLPFFLIALVLHEMGHLLAARACGVTISEFGLGWGPKIYGFRLKGVDCMIRALPIGAYVRLDLSQLLKRPLSQQVLVLLAGIIINLLAAVLTNGTAFSVMNYLLAATNILPLYQQDGWKCGMVMLRGLLQRRSSLVEWTFTLAGSGLSFVVFVALIARYIGL